MEIRLLEEQDIPKVIELGFLLHKESQYKHINFNVEKCYTLCQQVLKDSKIWRCFVAEKDDKIVGFLIGYLAEFPFSKETLASEHTLYILPKHRGGFVFIKLIRAFEKWAKASGVSEMQLGTCSGIETEKIKRMYKKLGYKAKGFTSMKGV